MRMTISRPGQGRRIGLRPWWLGVLVLAWSSAPAKAQSDEAKLHVLDFSSPREMKDFFHYTPDRIPFVSAHRGGPDPGFPENCIETFKHTLEHTWAVMEVDPRYTKDGQIVLMHDATLDRTSNGHGKVADHTLAELKKLRLKDRQGNVTPYQIPTLDEALDWARGKTVLVLDKKDVSAEDRAKAIQKRHAQTYAMVMCPKLEDAKTTYKVDKDILMEVFVTTRDAFRRFDESGVPWSNAVAFVSQKKPKDPDVFSLIHDRGAMCMMGTSQSIDRDFSAGKTSESDRNDGYRQLVRYGSDIIEADMAIAAGKVLQPLQDIESFKKHFFKKR